MRLQSILMMLAAVMAMAPGLALAQERHDLSVINLPPGFQIEVWSDQVPNARSLTLGSDGTVFIATRRDGRVFALRPRENAPPQLFTIASDLKMPNGVAYYDGDLYVAELTRIWRFADIEQHLDEVPEPVAIVDDLPDESHHGWRYIGIGPDGLLYVSIGAPCNVCDRPGFGRILRMDRDGGNRQVVAEGVRNSVGLTWHPDSGELWFTDNGRDMMGDDIPPGELNRAPRPGLHFGFPYCHAGDIIDPEFGEGRECRDYTAPAQKLGPHVAPLGLRFYTGYLFPAEYLNQLFIAEHGSWNRSNKIGYRISLVRMRNGRPVSYEVFADGWLIDEEVSGRPVDLLILGDGSMLVSDDKNGVIYRISYATPINVGVGP